MNLAAQDYLSDIPFDTWTLCHASRTRFQQYTNNVAESMNSKVFSLRDLSYLRLIYAIVEDSIKDRSAKLRETYTNTYTKHALSVLKRNVKSGRKIASRVVREDTQMAVVRNDMSSPVLIDRRVDLNTKSCTCKVFADLKIPCPHACAFLQSINVDPKSYISDMYLYARYRESFSTPITQQPVTELTCNSNILAPNFERRIGRPRRRRIRSRGEGTSQGRRQITCSICHEIGHNRASCPTRNLSA